MHSTLFLLFLTVYLYFLYLPSLHPLTCLLAFFLSMFEERVLRHIQPCGMHGWYGPVHIISPTHNQSFQHTYMDMHLVTGKRKWTLGITCTMTHKCFLFLANIKYIIPTFKVYSGKKHVNLQANNNKIQLESGCRIEESPINGTKL